MSARDVALIAIDATPLPGWTPRQIKRPAPRLADGRDIALAETLTTGVLKNLLLLQFLIEHFSGRKRSNVDGIVQKILAVGLYQLRFLDRVPASAAVDEAVEQTRRFGQRGASGFVNAVLRKAARSAEVPIPTLSNPREYATVTLSHPVEVWDKLIQITGEATALRHCAHNQLEPPLVLRLLHPLPAPVEGFVVHEQPGMVVAAGAKRAEIARWADEGLAQVQDATAAKVAAFCDIQPGQRVLDRCCGRGTKTMQLHASLAGQGQVEAMDPSEQRCESLRRTIRQRNVKGINTHCAGWISQLPHPEAQFDRILCDVPCSNSGVLCRRAEARFRQRASDLESVGRLQREIMEDSAVVLRPGGLLIYSTCSIWPEENRGRVEQFLAGHDDFALLREELTLPSLPETPQAAEPAERYHDGGYVAVLRRRG